MRRREGNVTHLFPEDAPKEGGRPLLLLLLLLLLRAKCRGGGRGGGERVDLLLVGSKSEGEGIAVGFVLGRQGGREGGKEGEQKGISACMG